MDVFKLLKQDHKEVKPLFKKIEKSSDSAVKSREKRSSSWRRNWNAMPRSRSRSCTRG